MTKEVLKLALEALELHGEQYPHMVKGYCLDAITAIKEALMSVPDGAQPSVSVEHEPVAWMHTKIDGVVVPHRPADLNRHPDRWTALYKDPKPCPTCEALARTVMLDQTSHDATPPQRKPLTEQEICAILEDINAFGTRLYTFARAIEAAHGIKGEA